MSETMKPAGAFGWTTIGAKNPRNEAARAAAGEIPAPKKPEPKKEEKKENKKPKSTYSQS